MMPFVIVTHDPTFQFYRSTVRPSDIHDTGDTCWQNDNVGHFCNDKSFDVSSEDSNCSSAAA